MESFLGKGAFAEVFRGTKKKYNDEEDAINIKNVAIKTINKEKVIEVDKTLELIINEIKIHWALEKCSNAVKLLEIFED